MNWLNLAWMNGQQAPTASPGVFGEAGGAVLAGPDRIDQQEFQRGHDDEPQQQRADDRDQDVGRRIEQPRAQEADEAGGLHRRRTLGDEVLADEDWMMSVSLIAPMLRPSRHP